ncbi:NIPSNAP family protein [Actinoallomurus rhizosphaericola]|uniref:NIPSNAP family protein n=1 Tax=Actinoallomurus rhizosphaericola TaxID=2952536 RepID=UPI0020939AD3|nr:NIPSNAP family protein [Actinoallomurus rhizosphaericola]MCO5994840.1 NIPSNAP family protein [Actinoallomurus rhizosphaericola]
MSGARSQVLELRQYTLHDDARDVLIDLFEREFVESQEATGTEVIGQFRDVDAADRFVWLRGFPDMRSREAALRAFYGGPVWAAHRDAARVTMVDTDDVLLLRPVDEDSGFPAPSGPRPPVGRAEPPSSLVVATLYRRDRPFDKEFAEFFRRRVRPVLTETGAAPLAYLQTEHAENTYPALPVRTGENFFVWFARFAGRDDLAGHLGRLERSPAWRDDVLPKLSAVLTGEPQRLTLAPTARSLLR